MNSTNKVPASLITMVRPDLDNVPDHRFPESYALRWYQAGEEQHWNRIERLADEQIQLSSDLWFPAAASHLRRRRQRSPVKCPEICKVLVSLPQAGHAARGLPVSNHERLALAITVALEFARD